MNVLDELRAIGVDVIPHGDNLAITPASKVPPALKERLRQHTAEVLAVLKSHPAKRWAKAIECRYDWIPAYSGLRLRCVIHHHAAGSNTVFRTTSGGRDTLAEMLERGILTGQASCKAFYLHNVTYENQPDGANGN